MPLSVTKKLRSEVSLAHKKVIRDTLREIGADIDDVSIIYLSSQVFKQRGWHVIFSGGKSLFVGDNAVAIQGKIKAKKFRNYVKRYYKNLAWFDGNPFVGESHGR